MSDRVTFTIPPHTERHEKIRIPTGMSITQGPDGSTTITESGFIEECHWCRSRWPCLPSRLIAATDERDQLRADLAAARVEVAACREVLIRSALHVAPEHCWCLEAIEVGSGHSPQCRMIRAYLATDPDRHGRAILEAAQTLLDRAGNAVSALRLAQQHAGKPDPSYMVLDVTRNTREDLEGAIDTLRRALGGTSAGEG